VEDKMFTTQTDNHHGDGRAARWCNAVAAALDERR
jgi:hypothetical protein